MKTPFHIERKAHGLPTFELPCSYCYASDLPNNFEEMELAKRDRWRKYLGKMPGKITEDNITLLLGLWQYQEPVSLAQLQKAWRLYGKSDDSLNESLAKLDYYRSIYSLTVIVERATIWEYAPFDSSSKIGDLFPGRDREDANNRLMMWHDDTQGFEPGLVHYANELYDSPILLKNSKRFAELLNRSK